MIYHWKDLELEITDFYYQHNRIIEHPQLKAYQLKPQTLKQVEVIKVQIVLGLIHHCKDLDLEMVEYDYHQDQTPSAETIPSQTSTP